MKVINAYFKMKIFLKRVEIIDTSLRVATFPEKLQSSKDYFVSLEELKISTALRTLAECFEKEALRRNQRMYSIIFLLWSKKMIEKAEKLEKLNTYLPTFKEIINVSIINYNKVFNDANPDKEERTCSLIDGVQFSIEDDYSFKRGISILELFIISEFDKKELMPSIEFEEFFLN